MTLTRWTRAALAAALLLTLAAAWQLPFPPSTAHERTSAGIFSGLLALEAAALALAGRRSMPARLLILALGVLGAASVVLHAGMIFAAQRTDGPPRSFVVLVLAIGTAMAAAAGLTVAADRRSRA